MELKNSGEIEKINARISDIESQLKTASGDAKQKLQDEMRSLEDKRDEMMASVKQGGEKLEEDFEDFV